MSVAGRKCHYLCPFLGDTAHHRPFSDRVLSLVPFDAIGLTEYICGESWRTHLRRYRVSSVYAVGQLLYFSCRNIQLSKSDEGYKNPLTSIGKK